MAETNGHGGVTGTFRVKSGHAEMLKGGVIMDVVTPEHARIAEDAAMIRTKGEAGSGNIVEATRHLRAVTAAVRRLQGVGYAELVHEAKLIGAPVELLAEVQRQGRLPVVTFVAGGIATPADA